MQVVILISQKISMYWMISRNGKEKQNESLNEKDPVDSIVEQSDIELGKKVQ